MMRVFRVSRLLASAGLVDPYWFTAVSRERGRVVHAIAEAVFCGQAVEVAAAWDGYRRALAGGVAALRFEPIWVERRISFADYTGRPDGAGFIPKPVGRLHAGPTVVDVKSGDPHPSHGIQLALYETLLDASGFRDLLPDHFCRLPFNRVGLYVRETGRYTLEHYDDPRDYGIAQAVLDVARWRAQHGLLDYGEPPADDPAYPAMEVD